jgi:hypothetical protein
MIRDIQEILSRLTSVFRGRTRRRGLDRNEARRQATLQMGDSNATRDLHRFFVIILNNHRCSFPDIWSGLILYIVMLCIPWGDR